MVVAGFLLSGACSSLPDVNLSTDKPLKVDINVRLDVYQHDGSQKENSAGDDPADPADASLTSADQIAKRKRDRMEEIQRLKNNRLVGENHRGLLTIRKLPLDEYGDYVKKTVEEENYDRNYLMRVEARQRGTLLHDVQETIWKENCERSFAGEWIEIATGEGTFTWKQKE